jgi:putative transposase
MAGVFPSLQRLLDGCWHDLSSRLTRWTKPLEASLTLQIIADLGRSNSELLAENTLLRQQLIILKRQVKRPTFTRTDRMLLILLARLVRSWQQSLVIVQPETVLRWHRELFRRYWKRKSKTVSHTPKVAAETIPLIQEMARNNRRLRCRKDSGGIIEIGHSSVQANHPEVHARSSHKASTRAKVEYVSAQPLPRHLGLRRAFR